MTETDMSLQQALASAEELMRRVEQELISMEDAGRLLGCTRQRVHALVKKGKFDTVYAFGRFMLPRAQVEARLLEQANSRVPHRGTA